MKKRAAYLGAIVLLVANGQGVWAGDGVQVTSMTTVDIVPVQTGPYTINGDTITYGVDRNVQITGVSVGSLALTRSAVSKPQIRIERRDNANVQGERLTFFYSGAAGGSAANLDGAEAFSMEEALNDDYITSGGLDVFLNVNNGVERANNIERVDFVVANGFELPGTAALLDEVGTIANEKQGNNTFKIAMITSVDSAGAPASYGPLRVIQGNVDYGNLGRPTDSAGNARRNVYMRNGTSPVGADNGPVGLEGADTNFIGLSFISFAALGATPGQTVYGYSLFATDMFDGNDLVGLTDAPLTTSGSSNGGDIFGGTYAVFSTAAAEAETTEIIGAPDLTAAKDVNVYDPDGTGLFALPGNEMIYTITVTNAGDGSPDSDSMFLVDSLPEDVIFFNGDIDGPAGPASDPLAFEDNGSGLSFSYASDVGFSTLASKPTDFSACNYTPAPGYDADVRQICIRPTGAFAHGTTPPGFSVSFRVRIK